MAGPAFAQECPRHRQSLFRVIGSLADSPFIPFASITGDDFARPAVESCNSSGIPMLHVGSGQHLRLFAYGITGGQGLETADHAFLNCHWMKGISSFSRWKLWFL